MPPYFRHAIEMWFQDSWQNTERRKLRIHFRAWRKVYRVSKTKRKEEMERRLKRASIRMRKKIEEARKKKKERKQSILQQHHHNSKMASLYRAFQGTRSMLGGLEDYHNETIIRKSSELLECLKRTIITSSGSELKKNRSRHEDDLLPIDMKRKSQKELDQMFHDRVDALLKSRSNRDEELLRDIEGSVHRSRTPVFNRSFEQDTLKPSKATTSHLSSLGNCINSTATTSGKGSVSFEYLVGLLK